MSTKTLLKTLPLDTLVCHDVFGLGTTTSIISNSTKRPEMRKVTVAFDDDQLDETVASYTNENGDTLRTRTILISFLEWDSEDETDKSIKIRKAKNDEPDDAVDGIEALFDNPEMVDDEDADDSDEGWVVATKKPEVDTDDTDNDEDDEDFEAFVKDEFDGDDND